MKEGIKRLYNRRRFGIKLGLDVVTAMLDKLGNPQESFGVIHAAGTNGKGSVCAVMESVLRASGYRTGMYTSPHLVEINERFRVDGEPISDEELASLVAAIEACAGEIEKSSGREPTFFECTTVMALEQFRRAGVELAVVETGMGGRFDATNVVLPLVSMITSISLEHTEHLGNDLESIAYEKGGIIKRGRPVAFGMMSSEASSVIKQIASEMGSVALPADQYVTVERKSAGLEGQRVKLQTMERDYGSFLFPLAGSHQLENLGVCAAAADILDGIGVAVSEDSFRDGASRVSWPGRCQVLSTDPPVILDGAHNPGAAEVLASTLEKELGLVDAGMVIGVCADKDLRNFLKPFRRIAKKVWAVPVANERGSDPEAVAAACAAEGVDAAVAELGDALAASKAWAEESGSAVCVTGSLFLVGEVLEGMDEKCD